MFVTNLHQLHQNIIVFYVSHCQNKHTFSLSYQTVVVDFNGAIWELMSQVSLFGLDD